MQTRFALVRSGPRKRGLRWSLLQGSKEEQTDEQEEKTAGRFGARVCAGFK